jgi:hypothetical protein
MLQYTNGVTQKNWNMSMIPEMTTPNTTEIIEQLNSRIKELELSLNELATSAFNVIKYMEKK